MSGARFVSGPSLVGKRRAGLYLLLLAVVLTYANSLGNGFHFDDFHTVVDNPAIRSLGNVPRFFTDATTFSVLPANRTYRPLVSLSLALDYALGQGVQKQGYVLWAFHLGTLVCFLVLVALLASLFEGILNAASPGPLNPWLALIAAGWFGLHPAMAETVNYVIQRGDLYCTLGCVAALLLYAREPAWRRFGIYLVPFALAMLSKPPAAVFPALLFAYVLFFSPSRPAADDRLPKFPQPQQWLQAALAALPALLLDAALLSLQSRMTPRTFTPSILSPAAYRLTEPYVWLRYVGQLFLPLHLNVDTDLQPIEHVDARVLLGCLLLAFLLAVMVLAARRRVLYPIAFGLLWFVLTQLPTSLYPLSEVENDHRMFFSFPGAMLAVVWSGYLLLRWAGSRWPLTPRSSATRKRLAAAVVLCALCGYAAATHHRNTVWRDEETLWHDDVLKSPGNGRGLMIYGLSQMGRGEYASALALFERAQPLTPNYATLEINLGVVTGALADRGDLSRVSEAEQHFQRASLLAPADDTAHTFYARWLVEHGLDAEAIAELQQAVQLNPSRTMPWELLLGALDRVGRIAEARSAATVLLQLEPGNQAATVALAASPSVMQNTASSAHKIQAQFWINASLAQYRARQWAAAMRSAQRALVLDPHSAEAHNNLAAAYGALGEWDLAIHAAEEAIALAPNLQIARNNLDSFKAQKEATQKRFAQPTTAQDFVEASLRLHQAGRYEESLAAAHRATELDPALAEAWNNVAANEEALHHWDRAISAAQEALRLRPDFALARNNLQWSLEQERLGVR